MWELIRANQRKSLALFLVLGIFLVFAGYIFGESFQPGGGLFFLGIALVIWIVLSIIAYFSGGSIMLAVSGAREVGPDIHPQLYNVVEEMKIAAGLAKMPKIYIINEEAPNAFATGRSPDDCAIAVTAGLLSRLSRDELQGVIAHEMSHIVNRDVLYMTFAGVTLGSLVLISEVYLRGLWFSRGSSRYRRSSRSSSAGGQAQLIIAVVAIVLAILGPVLARLLYLAISRKREYLADASAVRLTRYPEGLASALENIASSDLKLPRATRVTAPMYIINPLKSDGPKLSSLTSTHPPIEKRVAILRAIAGGANFRQYQKAFADIDRSGSSLIPKSGLADEEVIPIRPPTEAKTSSRRSRQRDMGDIIRAVDNFIFYPCACGLKIKIPPDLKEHSIRCPKCHREIEIPSVELAAAADIISSARDKSVQSATDGTAGKMSYRRKSNGWESFTCICGAPVQLSPVFSGKQISCSNCGRQIDISN